MKALNRLQCRYGFSNTKKSALLIPLNQLILPDLSFYSKIDNEYKDILSNLCTDEVITTWTPSFEDSLKTNLMSEERFKDVYEEAKSAHSEFQKINSEITEDMNTGKKTTRLNKSLSHFEIENASFDKNFHSTVEYNRLSVNSGLEKQLIQKHNSIATSGEYLGTLSRLDFCNFNRDYVTINVSRLRGRSVVKILTEVDSSAFDINGWLKENIGSRIREYSSENLERQMASRRSNVVGISPVVHSLEKLQTYFERINSNNFASNSDIWDNINQIGGKIVEFEFKGDNMRYVSELSETQYNYFLESLIKINEILKNMMIKTNFLSAKQYKEVSMQICRSDAASFYTSLVSMLISKSVFADIDINFLCREEDILLKLEFIKIFVKRFSDQYLSSWSILNKGDGEEVETESSNKEQKIIEDMYEHIKSVFDQGSSSSKKQIISKINSLLSNSDLKESVVKSIREELDRFIELNEHDSDYQNCKNYLETLMKMPFGRFSKENIELHLAKKILNDSHFGMDEVKERILQFMAVGKLKENMISSKIICLLGPPGVGKTSIAKSIADCLGRKFVRISLGGENDVSVIKGHRRTFLGSYPGKIVNALKTAETANPVILLDEIDKTSQNNYRGNLQDVLLEVLDPSQNHSFYDHYLDIPVDLSKVLFICSANILDSYTISPPLYDRLEVIELSGYTRIEKEFIFKKHLLPKLMKKMGLLKHRIDVNFPDSILNKLIEDYAREPGVRNLEKKTQSILEKIAHEFVEKTDDYNGYYLKLGKLATYEEKISKNELLNESENNEYSDLIKTQPIYDLTEEQIKKYLGPKIYSSQTIFHQNEDLIGFSFGLGYSAYGGSVLSIEVIELPCYKSDKDIEIPYIENIVMSESSTSQSDSNKVSSSVIVDEEKSEQITKSLSSKEIPISNASEGSLTITGSLGEVMKESVEIGYSFAKHYLYKLDKKNLYLENKNLHIHFPEGASKKDGPSAGITIVTALISASLKQKYNPNFAMTGEISLNGKVLKIGGLREKVLAAKREKITNVIVPFANKFDIFELKDYIKEGMKFYFVQNYDEVYKLIFTNSD